MNPSQAFGVAVRTIGLLLVLCATPSIYSTGIILAFGRSKDAQGVAVLSLILAVAGFLAGLWLLRGPKGLIAYAYPDDH